MRSTAHYLQGVILACTVLVPQIASACEPGHQEWKTSSTGNVVCLPTKMIAYLSCLEASGGGQVSVEKDDSGTGSKKVTVVLSGEGNGIIAGGKGSIEVDASKSEQAMSKLKKKFDPDNRRSCQELAAGSIPSDRTPTTKKTHANAAGKGDPTAAAKSEGSASPIKAARFRAFELLQPKPTDCHNATFKLRDTATNELYNIVLRDAEQFNACSVNFSAPDTEVAEQVARFVGLIGGGRYAFNSAEGDCKRRTFVVVDKQTGKKYTDQLEDNCKYFNFMKGPVQLATEIALYFNHN
ncbi:MAG: hypothetical protein JNJ46_14265 [Myxococcales bacterium]|nr:hypothetical protein [Myxococcales bacterium]